MLGRLAANHQAIRPTIARLVTEAPGEYRAPLVTGVVSRCKDPTFAELAALAGPAGMLAYWRRNMACEPPTPLQARDLEDLIAAARAVFADPRRTERLGSIESACIAAIDLLGDLPGTEQLLAELECMIGPDERSLKEWFASVRSRRAAPEINSAEGPHGWSEAHLSDANRAVDAPGGARAYLAAKPEDQVWVIAALEARVGDASVEPLQRVLAMTELAEVHHERASALADATCDDPVLAPISLPLSRFRSLAAAEQYCSDRGIRMDSFDTETDVFPNGHDHRLRKLALLVDDLAALEPWFDEIPPLEDDAEDEVLQGDERLPGHYRLRAYLPRATYEVISEERADWLDVTAMLGLLNKICADAGLAHRFLPVERDYSQRAWVAAGPADALEQAISDGALVPTRPEAAADRGIAFEDEALGRRRERDRA